MEKKYLIKGEFFGSRLDKWFKKNVNRAPQSFIEKNLRKGKIKVNGKRIKSSYKLKEKDLVITYNLKFTENNKNLKNKKYQPDNKEKSTFSKIFVENNDNFAVINKPAGISVQSGTKSKKNIIDIMRSANEFKNFSPYPVHRIDKETTGLLIIAKNRKYAQLFTSLFRIRKIHKVYLAIVVGKFKEKKGTLVDEIFHYEGNKKIKTKAITHFELLDSNNYYSLLKLSPQTGRKHQLRKQLLIKGHPILGDLKYRLSENIKKNKSFLMLHSYKINFSISNIKYNFTTNPPKTFIDTLKEKYLKNFLQ